jgi:hypothetical protein
MHPWPLMAREPECQNQSVPVDRGHCRFFQINCLGLDFNCLFRAGRIRIKIPLVGGGKIILFEHPKSETKYNNPQKQNEKPIHETASNKNF